MKAAVLSAAGAAIKILDVAKPVPAGDDMVLVRLGAAALNRRDYYITQGLYSKIRYPVIPGSDGCGRVEEAAEILTGSEVIINPSLNWGQNPKAQGAHFSAVGMPSDGTFAEYIAIPVHSIQGCEDAGRCRSRAIRACNGRGRRCGAVCGAICRSPRRKGILHVGQL
jgi:NADPH:quinone reductase-like Zn-dependent oxidoreductase